MKIRHFSSILIIYLTNTIIHGCASSIKSKDSSSKIIKLNQIVLAGGDVMFPWVSLSGLSFLVA